MTGGSAEHQHPREDRRGSEDGPPGADDPSQIDMRLREPSRAFKGGSYTDRSDDDMSAVMVHLEDDMPGREGAPLNSWRAAHAAPPPARTNQWRAMTFTLRLLQSLTEKELGHCDSCVYSRRRGSISDRSQGGSAAALVGISGGRQAPPAATADVDSRPSPRPASAATLPPSASPSVADVAVFHSIAAAAAARQDAEAWQRVPGPFHVVAGAVISCRNEAAPNGIAPRAHLDDGCVDVLAVRACSRPSYLQHLLRLTKPSIVRHSRIPPHHCTSLRTHAIRVPVLAPGLLGAVLRILPTRRCSRSSSVAGFFAGRPHGP